MGGRIPERLTTTSFQIPRDLREWARVESEQTGDTFSEIVRRALALYRGMPTHIKAAQADPAREEAPIGPPR